MIKKIEKNTEKIKISEYILRDLPKWFGLEESLKEYITNSSQMNFWAYFINNNPIGFISLKETSDYTAEIYVIGVLQDYHRTGIGKKLFKTIYEFSKENKYEFIQVKTVDEGYYKEYDDTIKFYKSLGFLELEVFPTLWDKHNPCLIMVKSIR